MWFIIIGIIICIIVIGALLGTFKMPEVNVLDVTNPPGTNQIQIDYNGTEFDIGIGLIVNVVSPNNLPIHLSDMHATVSSVFLKEKRKGKRNSGCGVKKTPLTSMIKHMV